MIDWILGKFGYERSSELKLLRKWLNEALQDGEKAKKRESQVTDAWHQFLNELFHGAIGGKPPEGMEETARAVDKWLHDMMGSGLKIRSMFLECFPESRPPVTEDGRTDHRAALDVIHRRMSAMFRETDDLRSRFLCFMEMQESVKEIREAVEGTEVLDAIREIKKAIKNTEVRDSIKEMKIAVQKAVNGLERKAVRKVAGPKVPRKSKKRMAAGSVEVQVPVRDDSQHHQGESCEQTVDPVRGLPQ